MALRGNIETFYLSSLLQLLSNDNKTGVLQLSSRDDIVKIFFKEGTIIYATSSKKEDRLGYILKSEGIIGTEELKNCLQIAEQQKQKLGKILVEKGHISTEDLGKFLHFQVEQILYNLFMWKKGEFLYEDTAVDLEEQIVVQIDTMGIILEASRRVDEISVLTKQIPRNNEVLKLSDRVKEKEEIKLNAREWPILSLIDGRRTIQQVIHESGYDEFEVYKILYSLISSGLVEKSKEAQPDSIMMRLSSEKDEKKVVEEPTSEVIQEEDLVAEKFKDTTDEENIYETKKSSWIKLSHRNLILGTMTGIIIISAVLLLLKQYDNLLGKKLILQDQGSIKAPQESGLMENKQEKTIADIEKTTIPEPKKQAPSTLNKESISELKVQPITEKEKRTYQDPNAYFCLTLPIGYTLLDKSIKKRTQISFSYSPNINIAINAQEWIGEWDPEEEMFNRILNIREGREGPSDLNMDHYDLIEFGGGKGYEIQLSGVRGSTYTKVQLYALVGSGIDVSIDIDCKNWRTLKVEKLFNKLKQSIVKTFLIYH